MNHQVVWAETCRPTTTTRRIQWSVNHWHKCVCVIVCERLQNAVVPLRSGLIIYPAAVPRYDSNQAKCHTWNWLHLIHLPQSKNLQTSLRQCDSAPVWGSMMRLSDWLALRVLDPPMTGGCLTGCTISRVKISPKDCSNSAVLVRNVCVCRHPPATY